MNNMNINLAMGGPVGGPMPMMNNGAPIPQPTQQQQQQQQQQQRHHNSAMNHQTLLNTYVYEYFLRNNMLECARAMVQSEVPIQYNNHKDESDVNGMGADPMDTDSKDQKLTGDLPEPAIPTLQGQGDGCFLYEWFCLFWEMFNAQRGKSNHGQVAQYINHTQAQSRQKQNQQQEMLRNIRPDQFAMMRNMGNGAMLKQNNLARTAMANNNPNVMMMQAKQNQMSRDPSDMDGNRQRPGSPGSNESAPSPSKKPRLDGPPGFNPNQPVMMPNGRPAQGAPGQQFQTFANQPPMAQAKSIQAYAQNLSQHHGAQMPNKQMPNPGGPQGQGSPMMAQGPDGATLNAYYNPNEMSAAGGMRPGPGGAQAAGGSNHALQDYQMQLMLLEQQNKKRLMMARQEQDNQPGSMPRPDGPPGPPGAPGQMANGQTFPAGERAAGSPNPTDQMKRNTPQMGNASIPSPLPEGAQSRGSPGAMNFIPNQMDPNLAPHFYKPGMEGNMPMNGGPMRPPSSHPNQQQFNGQQVTPQMMATRQQQGQPGGPGGPGMQWQGPQGGPQGPQAPQGPQSGPQGPRPVQNASTGAMPPPAAPPAVNNAANARNQTSSPQQTPHPPTPSQANKPNPKKKDSKSTKDKRAATQKKSANQNTGATPAAENTQDNEPPTPATPMTPSVNNFAAGKGNQPAPAAQPIPNGQTSTAPPAPAQVAPQPGQDPNQNGAGFGLDPNMAPEFMNFADPLTTNDVLDSFDFESFLHDEDSNGFDFNAGFGTMETEINAD